MQCPTTRSVKHMQYIGNEPALKGKTALVQRDPNWEVYPTSGKEPPLVIAQFDDLSTELNGINLAHGWHIFESKDFQKVPDEANTDNRR